MAEQITRWRGQMTVRDESTKQVLAVLGEYNFELKGDPNQYEAAMEVSRRWTAEGQPGHGQWTGQASYLPVAWRVDG